MKNYQIVFSKKAQKDIRKLTEKQKAKLKTIFQEILAINPYIDKQLKGKLSGFYSYRLNRQDSIIYEILEDVMVVFVIRTKTHYGE